VFCELVIKCHHKICHKFVLRWFVNRAPVVYVSLLLLQCTAGGSVQCVCYVLRDVSYFYIQLDCRTYEMMVVTSAMQVVF